MPRGWFGQPRRHSIAAKLGWSRRHSKLPKYDTEKLRRIHANRRPISRLRDERKTAKKVVPEDKISEDEYISQVHSWAKDQGHSDIENIDTKKKTETTTKAEKQTLKLPSEGNSTTIDLEPNKNGARTLTVKNWKGLRLYINYDYRTEYNPKSKSLGWIAVDGSDWDLKTQYVPDDVKIQVKQIKEQTKLPKITEKTKKTLGKIEIIDYGDGSATIAGSLKHHGSALMYEVEDTLEKNKSDWINKTHQSFPSKNISEVEKTLDKYYDVKIVSLEEYKKETEKMIAEEEKK